MTTILCRYPMSIIVGLRVIWRIPRSVTVGARYIVPPYRFRTQISFGLPRFQ